ncbi:MAG: cell wall-binding repeat-containing protein [Candidatus Saccharibacteria bacterium]
MLRLNTDITADTVRIYGRDAVDLAVNISNLVWPDSRVFWKPGAVVLLSLNSWQDAVAGVPLQHFPNNAALLGTEAGRLSNQTREEILRLSPTGLSPQGEVLPAQVYVVGNINRAVERSIRGLGYRPQIITGDNPAETAAGVARMMAEQMPNPPIILVPSDAPADSQPVVGLAAHGGSPILFVERNQVPGATTRALSDIKPTTVYIMGRDANISVSVIAQIRELLPNAQVIRVGGSTTTDYSINVAKFLDPERSFGWGRTKPAGDVFSFVAEDRIYQSIFAATLSHMATHAPELIIPSQSPIPESLRQYLISINPPMGKPPQPPFMRGWIIGTTRDISVQQQVELETLLIKEQGDWPPAP